MLACPIEYLLFRCVRGPLRFLLFVLQVTQPRILQRCSKRSSRQVQTWTVLAIPYSEFGKDSKSLRVALITVMSCIVGTTTDNAWISDDAIKLGFGSVSEWRMT
jgi:hypothetical protein